MAGRIAAALAATLLLRASALAGFPAGAGVAEALLGRWEQALDRFDASPILDRAERFYRSEALLHLGQPNEALPALRELSRSAGSYSGPALERAVSVLFEAGRYGEVLDYVEGSSADRFQDEARLRFQIGQSYYLANRPEKALDQLSRVTAGRYLPYALYTMGLIMHVQGNSREAVETLGRAAEAAAVHPDPAVAAALVDRILLTRGHMIYQVAVGTAELSPENRTRLLRLARSQFSRIAPEGLFGAGALRGLGWCDLELGDAPRALAEFEAATGRDPSGRHEDLQAQGRVYQKLGYFDEAARSYAEARREALSQAKALSATPAPAALPKAGSESEETLRTCRTRLEELAGALREIEAALGRRRRRIESVGEELASRQRRAAALEAELEEMGRGLDAYLDAMPAWALLQESDRPRFEQLMSTQERVLGEVDSLVNVFERLGESSVWNGANSAQKARGEVLARRLGIARAALSRARLAFLEGLKALAGTREKELRETIESHRSDASTLDPAFDSAWSSVRGERERAETLESRWKMLSERRDALAKQRNELEMARQRALAEQARRTSLERAEALRLRANAYALDETEALHLWEEQADSRPGGERP